MNRLQWLCLLALLFTVFPAVVAAEPTEHAAPVITQPDDAFGGNACVQCHRDLPGRSSEIVELEWKQSVHYQAKVGCDGCHGGNASLRPEQFATTEAFKNASHLHRNPQFVILHQERSAFVTTARGRSVSFFCGKCHAQIKEKHLGSPHGDFGDPTCLYCHGQGGNRGSHKITPPTTAIIDTRSRAEKGRCSPCHQEPTMQTVGRIKTMLDKAEEQIQTSAQAYEQLEQAGYRNLDLENLLHHTEQVRSKLRRIFHSFNMREIKNFTSEINEASDKTLATAEMVINLRDAQRRQTVVGLIAVLVLLSFAGLLVYYKNTYLEPEHH